MERTIDYIRDCPGYWEPDYRYRIEVYEHPGLTPVVICTPLLDPAGDVPMVHHAFLAAEVIRAHAPHLFDALDEPLVWIDRNPHPQPSRYWPGDTAYRRVTFDRYTPRDEGVWSGAPLVAIGTATVGMMSRAAVTELLDGTTRRPCSQGCGRPATVEREPARAGDSAPWLCAACNLAAESEDDEEGDEA